MKAYDPLPDFDCNDPYPSAMPHARPSRWPIILGAGCWIVALVLVGVLVAGQIQ